MARDLAPESFGGLWITGEDPDEDTVYIAFAEDAEENVDALAEEFPYPEMLSAVSVENSFDELEAQQWEMITDRELSRAGELEIPDVPPAAYDLDIDIEANRVVVMPEEATPDAQEWFEDRYGEDIAFEEGPLAGPTVCNSKIDCEPMRSGLAVETDEGTICSVGFAATWDNSPRLIGSGHCGLDDGPVRYHRLANPLPYGISTNAVVQGRVDAARHRVDNPWSVAARIYVDNSEKGRPVHSEASWDNLAQGQRACMGGAMTFSNCGDITGKNFSPTQTIPNANRFVKAEFCSAEGDSGAGVYRNSRALGIQSGRRHGCGDPGWFSYFGSIQYAQNQVNAELVFVP